MLEFLKDEVVFVGAARTPVGAYLGDLKTVKVQELGVIALKEADKDLLIRLKNISQHSTIH